MRLPWQNLTGLAKSAAIFASMFLISLGLCGANGVAFQWCDGWTTAPRPQWLVPVLVITGIVEGGVIVLSAVGLIGVAFAALAQWIHRRFSPSRK